MNINKLAFVTLRHREIEEINKFCTNQNRAMWALGDCYLDWRQFSKMKKDDVLILKIHDGGTHVFPESAIEEYKNHLNPSVYFKITCDEDMDDKEEWERGMPYTFEEIEIQ